MCCCNAARSKLDIFKVADPPILLLGTVINNGYIFNDDIFVSKWAVVLAQLGERRMFPTIKLLEKPLTSSDRD